MEIIKDVINGKLSKKDYAIKICQTIRNVNLLSNKYKKYGYTAFIHKNTGRISNKKKIANKRANNWFVH
ncbi:hypothetical protein STABA_v1c00920 [Spiroplasma tabanidicola]|uniref:Uncharacterized protein n=1 Tax=Spiroplasma tabanidicola TaxID=324079 RepID=A0A6I6C7Q0_9MOLU|nr:hypothetical protein [Spiroplasma tabanidicola]QGS51459.1 hypothetical protein STABA_v1c00920 [Spiroplasma tabanidicola]